MSNNNQIILAVVNLILICATTSATTIGVTYNPNISDLTPPEHVVSALLSHHIYAVRLLHPTPNTVRAFSYTNISLLLSLPNFLIPSFATDISYPNRWVKSHILPFFRRTQVSMISLGSDFLVADTHLLIPALRNLRSALTDNGIQKIPVSTTFSFVSVMSTIFPPSSVNFKEPANSLVIQPLLQLLQETNSSFLIDISPYTAYKIDYEIPFGFALFQHDRSNFGDDVVNNVRYENLYDAMLDGVISSIGSDWQNIPVIVASTGWPCEMESKDAKDYVEMYFNGLIGHLKLDLGTPLSKGGATEAYINALFDEDNECIADHEGSEIGEYSSQLHHCASSCGILYYNMSTKFDISYSSTECTSQSHVENEMMYYVTSAVLYGSFPIISFMLFLLY